MSKRHLLVPLGIAAAIAAIPGLAWAAWNVTGSATDGSASVGSITTPTGGSAAAAGTTSMTITWTAPTAGATAQGASTYFVTGGGTCNAAAIAGTCTVNGLSAGQTYSFQLTAKRGTNWTSTTSTAFSGTTTGSGDTTAPTWTPTCPANGSGPWTLTNSGTWQASTASGGCNSQISGAASDATGVAKIELSIAESGSTQCWNGTTPGSQFNASCPTFTATTLGTPNGTSTTWSIPMNRNTLSPSKTYTVSVRATDRKSPANVSTSTYTFTTG
jgi:chitinase